MSHDLWESICCYVVPSRYAKKLARTAGLPTYKFVVPIRKKADRDKLDAKACPDCQKVCCN